MIVRQSQLGAAALLRPWALAVGLLGLAGGCAGDPSRLVTVHSGKGEGPVELEVKNLSDVAINNLYLARSEQLGPELDFASPEGQKVWGPDLLSAAIPRGSRFPIPVAGPGRWDARALDRDNRYQHVSGLKLDAGGRYILELNEGGWRVK
jgi:hypothetical protein